MVDFLLKASLLQISYKGDLGVERSNLSPEIAGPGGTKLGYENQLHYY